MISSNNGRVKVEGHLSIILADLSVLVMAMKDTISEELDADETEKLIREAVEHGFEDITDEEVSLAEIESFLKALKEMVGE